MSIHEDAPSWFKCLSCLWYSMRQEGNKKGQKDCMIEKGEFKTGSNWHCPNWICRRCLTSWDYRINHNFCKPAGRSRPKEVKL